MTGHKSRNTNAEQKTRNIQKMRSKVLDLRVQKTKEALQAEQVKAEAKKLQRFT